jgi:hypothetical protein
MLTRFKKIFRHKEGTAMIEFAILAPIFFLLLFAMVEFGLILFVSSTVSTVVNQAGRLGMTGGSYSDLQDPSAPLPRDALLRKVIHDRLGPLSTMGEITINAQPYSSLEGLSIDPTAPSSFGGGGQLVLYKVEFAWKIMTPMMGQFLGEKGEYIITATTVMQNEEF